jgi:hypothetical protein
VGGERGSVTAEFAAALPAVVLLLGLTLAAFAVGSQAVRLQDAAGLAARAMARGEGASEVSGAVDALVPGAAIERRERSGLVCAVLATRAAGVLAGIELRAESCALAEQ